MTNIHPTAIIDPSAKIAETAIIGAYCLIGEGVEIGENTHLLNHVVVRRNTKIGAFNKVFQFATLGEDCQDLKYNGEETYLEIGDYNTIRESCTFHRGTAQDHAITKVGNHNLFMVNTHIAHDCVVGNRNILANNVGVAGHVHIGNHVIIGGNSGIHQFCRIDDFCMIGGSSLILKDIMAMTMVSGNPAKVRGLNIEGMKRKGWSKETIRTLRQAYKIIFQKGFTTEQAITTLKSELLEKEEKIQLLINSLENSTRGITR
ncbi:MAG: acyl-ACP--UDP-N-acetylglucosamine O-acyltransferase [Moraxellaceae bacterium]|nr:acyl-ACP--UDP-N-acetylglucosamine O-acyltransferase [Moraxellaceae bacterium]